MPDISGKTERLMGLSQCNNNVLLVAIPPPAPGEGVIDWYFGNLFTHDIRQSGRMENTNAAFGLALQCVGEEFYCLYCYPDRAGDGYGPVVMETWRIVGGQIDHKHDTETSLGFETTSTPSTCVIGEVIFVVYRDRANKLKLGSFNLVTRECDDHPLSEDHPVTTGPGIVPIMSQTSGLSQKLLLVWTSDNDTSSVVVDPVSGAFGNLQSVPGNGSPNDICLRLLADDTAILVQKGRTDTDSAQVLTYKSGPDFSGKWSPHAHELSGVIASQTPCILPYTALDDIATGPVIPSGIATGLLVAYPDTDNAIQLKSFDTAHFA